MNMGHANSTSGTAGQDPRFENLVKSNFDSVTTSDVNGSHTCAPHIHKPDNTNLNGNIPHCDPISEGGKSIPGFFAEVDSVCEMNYEVTNADSMNGVIIEDVELDDDDDDDDYDDDDDDDEEEYDSEVGSAEQLPRTVPTVFRWEHGGNEVYLTGSFSDWNARIPMNSSHGEFETIIELPEGDHQFKYLVDGNWIHDPNLPTTSDTYGGRNNVVSIKKSDFEVMAALNSDDQKTRRSLLSTSSVEGSYGQLIPSHHTPLVVKDDGMHSSVPPALPPQLLNVNLNKPVVNIGDPSLLHEPNHVSVNHMYALSIKDGVLVVSSCMRYRKKFITTILYRPVSLPER